ncbi:MULTISPECIES: GTPase HflX [Streptomycetaceae]|uniref:GTPase HflX n=1 Tax=Streptantibioticus cattleyicolor (strain ATCC 35852 / DSM 46488 / JCM 4925 / NBRC 14057 / NRRL 8057) TaxID=1003195 RepID=F8JUU2_STREN|nr:MULTISPECIES: GTPase HflX [Streptomycetaceae]AEW96927.1 putative GTP-ase [Streptantibioticus cattleyicolor NRRL 8057 = DSM 46488]MYS61403.1 GTPase HflX [Streptomyces sp. SID5468]CCB77256.1 putative ATP/GTP-binding protein [Streptantibioticus cattleyicolor NRRL 8057 = DSM 46488]
MTNSTSSSSAARSAAADRQRLPESLRATALMEEDVAWSLDVDGERDGDQFDRSERASLRRVAGLSTELQDVTEVEYRQLRLERVVLVGVWTDGTVQDAENSLAELAALAETAGALVLDGVIQRRDKPDPATYIGSGKAQELRDIVLESGADTVVCDGELSPGQLIHLEDVVKVKVVDRTALILDIFAQHAKSREGKAQVALAQMQYMLPRLRGWGQSLSRQMGGGGSGSAGGGMATRGPGETKIETDRRRIREKMAKLRREIAEMKTSRDLKRQERRRHQVPSVAIAGYTNAGKSSLLNRLTGAGVLVENALFATLDPTVRRAETPSGRLYTLADTVGFVRHLPHHLVEAFRSTMEEVADADLVLHVVDGAHPVPEEQLAAVREVLRDVGAADVPEIVVINKADAADPLVVQRLLTHEKHAIAVSARSGEGVAELLALLDAELPRPRVEIEALVPYTHGALVSRVHVGGEVISEEHTAEGTLLKARVHDQLAAELGPFALAVQR